jgi:hypothetical protein
MWPVSRRLNKTGTGDDDPTLVDEVGQDRRARPVGSLMAMKLSAERRPPRYSCSPAAGTAAAKSCSGLGHGCRCRVLAAEGEGVMAGVLRCGRCWWGVRAKTWPNFMELDATV